MPQPPESSPSVSSSYGQTSAPAPVEALSPADTLLAPILSLRLAPPEPGDGPAADLLLELASHPSAKVSTPAWGLAVELKGDRDWSTVFRVPERHPWARAWLFSRPHENIEAFSEVALQNTSTQSTTVYRAVAPDGSVFQSSANMLKHLPHPSLPASTLLPMFKASLACHWFLCPYESLNGITIGVVYFQVVYEKLDRKMTVQTIEQPFGRFAMDENTGEVIITFYRDGVLLVGWIQSVATCERVRETFMFPAPEHEGRTPDFSKLICRNSWYERRKCNVCGVLAKNGCLSSPCIGGPLRGRQQNTVDFEGFHKQSRRFRGNYFGICTKRLYTESEIITDTVRVVVAIRKAPRYVDVEFKKRLLSCQAKIATSYIMQYLGLDPRSCARMLLLGKPDIIRAIGCAAGDSSTMASAALSDMVFELASIDFSPNTPSKRQCGSTRSPSRQEEPCASTEMTVQVEDVFGSVRRRRNADTNCMTPAAFARRKRNRIAADIANKRRKLKLEQSIQELREKKMSIQVLTEREHLLRLQNMELRRKLASLDAKGSC